MLSKVEFWLDEQLQLRHVAVGLRNNRHIQELFVVIDEERRVECRWGSLVIWEAALSKQTHYIMQHKHLTGRKHSTCKLCLFA